MRQTTKQLLEKARIDQLKTILNSSNKRKASIRRTDLSNLFHFESFKKFPRQNPVIFNRFEVIKKLVNQDEETYSKTNNTQLISVTA